MNPQEYSQWYYLIYLMPGGIALALLLLSSVSGGARHHHGHHRGGGGHRHQAAAGPKHSSKHAARSNGQRDQAWGQAVLSFFGVGRVPGAFIWGSALLGWALGGYWATRTFEYALHIPGLFVVLAFIIALLGSLVCVKCAAEAGSRLMPQTESFATDTIDLCGQIGSVAYPVDESRGRVHVYDAHGTMHDSQARLAPGHTLPITRGSKVLVVDYDAEGDFLIVEEE